MRISYYIQTPTNWPSSPIRPNQSQGLGVESHDQGHIGPTSRSRPRPPSLVMNECRLTDAVCLLCEGQFSFYAQPAPSTTSASNIVDFIDRSIAQSRAGQSLYFLRAQKPGSAAGSASSVPVQLLYPVSRPGHLVDHAPSAVTSPLSSSSSSSSAAAVGRTPHHSAASRRRTADLLG